MNVSVSEGLAKRGRVQSLLPGLVAALGIAGVAVPTGRLLPVVGAPVIAIILGVAVAVVRPLGSTWRPGLSFAGSKVLQWSIVLLGTGLSLHQVARIGVSTLPILAGTLGAAGVVTFVAGRLLGVRGNTRTLIGVGTAICGASAIAATDAVIGAEEQEVAYAIATIFTFNVLGVLLFPVLGHLIGMSQHAFGLWAGTAVNDTSSVVAAASAYGHGARDFAVVVKLTRSILIVPIVVALALWRARSSRRSDHASVVSLGEGQGFSAMSSKFPWFIGWFLVASCLQSLHVIPASWHSALSETAIVMITIALASIGLSTRLRSIREAGVAPLLLGAVLWVTVAAVSIGVQALTGTL